MKDSRYLNSPSVCNSILSIQAGTSTVSPALKSLGKYILLPQSLHRPFYARLVLLKQAKSTAKAFYQFLQTKKARLIFDRYGFLMPADKI